MLFTDNWGNPSQVNYRSVLNGCLKAGTFRHLESPKRGRERVWGFLKIHLVSKYDSAGPQLSPRWQTHVLVPMFGDGNGHADSYIWQAARNTICVVMLKYNNTISLHLTLYYTIINNEPISWIYKRDSLFLFCNCHGLFCTANKCTVHLSLFVKDRCPVIHSNVFQAHFVEVSFWHTHYKYADKDLTFGPANLCLYPTMRHYCSGSDTNICTFVYISWVNVFSDTRVECIAWVIVVYSS